jgi:hypothetical protein
MTRYALTYELSPDMLTRAMMSWSKPLRTRVQKWRRFGMGFALYIVLVSLLVVLLQTEILNDDILLGLVIGCLGGLAVWAAVYRYSTGKLTNMVHVAQARYGPVDTVFCAQYVEISSAISTARMQWQCFDHIGRIEDATVLRAGGIVYAVPDAALPDGVSAEKFLTDLNSWMEAAA